MWKQEKYGSPTPSIVLDTNKVLPSSIRKRDKATMENLFSEPSNENIDLVIES